MVVPVPIVLGMAVSVVDVVHMIRVRHRDVAAAGAVLMVVALVDGVGRGLARIGVVLVRAVQVPVVHVVGVVAVRYRDVTASGSVYMGVQSMRNVRGCRHGNAFSLPVLSGLTGGRVCRARAANG